MKVVDVGKVVRIGEFVNKKGDLVFVVVVEGTNGAWKVFSRKPFAVDDRVVVFERNGRYYVSSLDEWK